jgi:lipid-A-disaccharide synthase-like uncharacterized protein
MSTSADGQLLWAVSAFIAVYFGLCLVSGWMPTARMAWIKRSEMPRAYWTFMAMGGVALVVFVSLALHESLPGWLSASTGP